MRCSERELGNGEKWWFVIEEDTDTNMVWVYKKELGVPPVYVLADEVIRWIETNIPTDDWELRRSICAVLFKKKSQAMLFRLTWDNNGPYRKA